MSGGGLFGFLVSTLGLMIVVWMFFVGMTKVAADATLALLAKIAIGGMALIAFILAAAAVLGLGGGGRLPTFGPANVIEFAISIIVVIVAVFIINAVIDFFVGGVVVAPPAPGTVQPPQPAVVVPAGVAGIIKYVVQACALIALLIAAGKALFGGGLGIIPANILGRQAMLLLAAPGVSS